MQFFFAIDNCAVGRSCRPELCYVHGSRFYQFVSILVQNAFVCWSTATHAFVFCVHSFLKLQTKQANETMWNLSGCVIVCPVVRMPFAICTSHQHTNARLTPRLDSVLTSFSSSIKSFLAISHTNTVSCMNKRPNVCMQRSFNGDKETTKLNLFAVASTFSIRLHISAYFFSFPFVFKSGCNAINCLDRHTCSRSHTYSKPIIPQMFTKLDGKNAMLKTDLITSYRWHSIKGRNKLVASSAHIIN